MDGWYVKVKGYEVLIVGKAGSHTAFHGNFWELLMLYSYRGRMPFLIPIQRRQNNDSGMIFMN